MSQAFVSPRSHRDNPRFRGLVVDAAQRFDVRKVMADMAYSSRLNHELARKLGFELFVPYEYNPVTHPDDGSAWSED